MSYHTIHLQRVDGIARLTLARPELHNAFDAQMISELNDALANVAADQQLRVLILQAQGKNFSAGADLHWMRSMAEQDYQQNIADAGQLSRLMEQLDALPQTTIAQVQGAAFGGAVGLIACCDIAIADAAASFCLSEVKIGLIPAVISPYVMRAIGTRQARRYLLSAERFNADTALQLGLLHEVSDQLAQRVNDLANQLLANGPAAMRAAKRLIHQLDQQVLDRAVRDLTIAQIAEIRVSPEGQEGLTAFLEKRTPRWK